MKRDVGVLPGGSKGRPFRGPFPGNHLDFIDHWSRRQASSEGTAPASQGRVRKGLKGAQERAVERANEGMGGDMGYG